MEQSDSADMMFRLQGQTIALRSLKTLRAEVNANA